MHWIIQENLYNEEGYLLLLAALNRLSIRYDVVKVVPFSHDIIPEVNPTGLTMVCGSTTLSALAIERGWTPGSFLNDNHDFHQWQRHYGEHLLNSDAKVCRFDDVEHVWDEFFIRPCADTKTFAGMVTTWDEFVDWQRRVLDLKETYTTLDASTLVCYSTVKEIWSEYRFFVVDGKIITYSLYKRGNRVVYDAVVEDDAIAFSQQMVDLWQPARGFVLDIGLTAAGYRIIEINCLNSAGFYAANVQKLAEAIESMPY